MIVEEPGALIRMQGWDGRGARMPGCRSISGCHCLYAASFQDKVTISTLAEDAEKSLRRSSSPREVRNVFGREDQDQLGRCLRSVRSNFLGPDF